MWYIVQLLWVSRLISANSIGSLMRMEHINPKSGAMEVLAVQLLETVFLVRRLATSRMSFSFHYLASTPRSICVSCSYLEFVFAIFLRENGMLFSWTSAAVFKAPATVVPPTVCCPWTGSRERWTDLSGGCGGNHSAMSAGSQGVQPRAVHVHHGSHRQRPIPFRRCPPSLVDCGPTPKLRR